MKVLIINKKDISGGAARAAYRIHLGLLKYGVESEMLVMEKSSNDPRVHLIKLNLFDYLKRIIYKIVDKLYKKDKEELFSTASFGASINKSIKKIKPDLIHLHWIPRGFISLNELKKIDRPIAWSLHDMWPFTGGCHYDNECGNFIKGCGFCPILFSNKNNDLSRKVFNRKQKAYESISKLTIIGLSRWMTGQASNSKLFKNSNVINLPNCIDTSFYRPLEKEEVRRKFNLPIEKKIILFGAMDATSDKRKGYEYLKKAINQLQISNIELLIVGNTNDVSKNEFKIQANSIGNVNNDYTLVELFSAADVTIVPSLQENLSNVIMESLSCGTPVIGFNTGGNEDLIEHKQNGYLANLKDANSLQEGIEWVLEDDIRLKLLSKYSREKVLKEFDEEIVTEKYINEYNKLLIDNN